MSEDYNLSRQHDMTQAIGDKNDESSSGTRSQI